MYIIHYQIVYYDTESTEEPESVRTLNHVE
jgi:hypothetical protein